MALGSSRSDLTLFLLLRVREEGSWPHGADVAAPIRRMPVRHLGFWWELDSTAAARHPLCWPVWALARQVALRASGSQNAEPCGSSAVLLAISPGPSCAVHLAVVPAELTPPYACFPKCQALLLEPARGRPCCW